MFKNIVWLSIITACLYSCKPLNPSIMFKTDKDYEYDKLSNESVADYKIAPNDVISFRLFTNNGFKLIDITTSNNTSGGGNQQVMFNQGINYTVEYDGSVNLPILGRVNIAGKTIREAEFFLEEEYKDGFINPFILLTVQNRRVTVFLGDGGSGSIVPLNNNNMTLLEGIAQAGGLANTGRADRIKLIRGELSDPKVYLIDLSTIEGIAQANIILQANDMIYVEPVGITGRQLISEISPFLSFITSTITLYFFLENIKNN